MWNNNIVPTSYPTKQYQNIEHTVANHAFPNQFQYNTVDSTIITILPSVAIQIQSNQTSEDIIPPSIHHIYIVLSLPLTPNRILIPTDRLASKSNYSYRLQHTTKHLSAPKPSLYIINKKLT